MNARTVVATIALGSAIGCSAPPPEQQFINDAMSALGGRSRVEAAKTVIIEGKGLNYNLGQDMKPEVSTQTFEISGYVRKIDVANRRQRIEQTRTPQFAYFQGPQPQTQIQALDGDVAFNVNPAGVASRAPASVETDRRFDIYHHPLVLLRAANDAKASVTNVRSVGALRQADIMTPAGIALTMTVDAGGLPLSISSKAYHANLGNVLLTTAFSDYQDVNGLKLPGHFTGKVDEFTTWDIQATKQALDADVGDLAAPSTVAGKPATAAPPNVVAEPIAKGVWLLGGQSHHSVLVEFSDHLMLIEAPQSEARTLAVIAKAKETVPGKPLTELVTTHHHFDHTAGMRAAIAEGMTVVTHSGNKEWVDNMARRPHALNPDMLAKNASRLNVDTVDGEREYADQSMRVMLYHVAGNPHSDTMLMAYIPRDRILIEVDAFSPGSAAHPYAGNLLENIRKRNLQVDKVVPLHGAMVPFAELVKTVGVK